MRVSIELDLLPKYNVTPSKYHGGKMEGPAVRNMLEHGKEIFDDITNFIHTNLGNEDSRDLRNYASNEEVKKTCEKYGSLCVILDAVVSYIYSVDNTFDNDHIEELERRLSLLRKAWASTSLSFTPKMHLLLDHISNQVQYIRGFKTMGEDRIERSHQTRDSIDQQLSRLKDKKKKMDSQAKLQKIATIDTVKKIQIEVQTKTRKRTTRSTSLRNENNKAKKEKRNPQRNEMMVTIASNNYSTESAIKNRRE